jgi:hypothetical protein
MRNTYSTRSYESERGYYADGLGTWDDEGAANTTPSGAATRQADAPWYETLAKTVVPAALSIYQQQQLTKLNLARINTGQPPINAQDYARQYQPPSAQVQFGPDAGAKKLMMYGGLALLGYVGLRAAKVI